MDNNLENNNKTRHVLWNKKRTVLFTAFLFVCLIFGSFSVIYSLYFQSAKDAFIEANTIYITPKVSGEIIELRVGDNTEVKKGEIIAQIDPEEFKTRLKDAQMKLEKAQADLSVSKSDTDKINASLKKAKNDIEAAAIHLERANSDYVLYKNAYKDGSVTKQDLDNAIKNLNTSREEYRNAQENTKIADNALQLIISKKESKSTEIKNLIAQIEEASLNLSNTTLIAPADGTIINKNIKLGSYVKKGEPALSIISKDYYVIADFSEPQKSKMKKGQKVTIKLNSKPAKELNAEIDDIKTGANAPVKIIFKDNIEGFNIITGTKVNAKVKIR